MRFLIVHQIAPYVLMCMEKAVQFLLRYRAGLFTNMVSTYHDSSMHILAELSSRILSNDKPMAAVTSIVQASCRR